MPSVSVTLLVWVPSSVPSSFTRLYFLAIVTALSSSEAVAISALMAESSSQVYSSRLSLAATPEPELSKPKPPVKIATPITATTITARAMGSMGFFRAAATPTGALLGAAPTDAVELAADAEPWPKGLPQLPQKTAPSCTSFPHFVQNMVTALSFSAAESKCIMFSLCSKNERSPALTPSCLSDELSI